MMGKTKIEWTDKTWNPLTGCTKISPGCQNCYAERMSKRFRGRCGYPADDPFKVTFHPDKLEQPLQWKKPSRIFVCSMGDLGHEDIVGKLYTPETPYNPNEPEDKDGQPKLQQAIKIIQTISRCYWHTFVILTKRPEGLKFLLECAKEDGDFWPQTPKEIEPGFVWNSRDDFLPNLLLGITAENQKAFNDRWAILKKIPACVYMVSYEPALGPLVLSDDFLSLGKRACVVVGGESGPKARPMHLDWARGVRDQCVSADVPFFFKQFGEYREAYQFNSYNFWVNHVNSKYSCLDLKGNILTGDHDFKNTQYPVSVMRKVGKKTAGRILDGKTWDQVPEVKQ